MFRMFGTVRNVFVTTVKKMHNTTKAAKTPISLTISM